VVVVAADNSGSGAVVKYLYDGLGQRVAKTTVGVSSTTCVYDAFGSVAASYTTATAPGPAGSTCGAWWLSVQALCGNLPAVIEQPSQQMQCMEVWGGSQLTARGVEFGGLDAWVYSKPHGNAEHGGDVYYASSCGTGRITRLLLADVSGHGNAAAATAADLRALMRRSVNRLDQTEFVSHLNRKFAEMSVDGTYATAIVTTFFSPTRRLTICNAGHPRPILYSAATRQWRFLSHEPASGPVPRNTPLGMLQMSEYDQFDIELQPGDYVLCYTDALIESNGADGEMLGESGLLKIVRLLANRGAPESPQEVVAKLIAEIEARYPENLTEDDVTLLVVKANGRGIRYSNAEKIRALGRALKSLIRAERPPVPDWNIANVGGAIIPALARRWRAKPWQASEKQPS
jgi:sigma-B regulation protein RsbU (phosphoserine phosphatase)